jgi:hypothetical protein
MAIDLGGQSSIHSMTHISTTTGALHHLNWPSVSKDFRLRKTTMPYHTLAKISLAYLMAVDPCDCKAE